MHNRLNSHDRCSEAFDSISLTHSRPIDASSTLHFLLVKIYRGMLFTQRIDQSTCRILYIKWNLVVRGSWFVVGGWWLVVRGSWFVVRGRRFLCTYSTVARFFSEIVPTDSSSPYNKTSDVFPPPPCKQWQAIKIATIAGIL